MSNPSVVTHTGRISQITDKEIKVSIISQSACAACHAKGACSASDMAEKEIDVPWFGTHAYAVGDEVVVELAQNQGIKAVLLGYIVPFFVLLISLLVFIGLGENEGIAGLLSLLMLIPYYVILSRLKKYMSATFEFRIKS